VVSYHPNPVWGIDITYIRLQKHWMYLVAILDWYSRYVVNWQLDHTLDIDFLLVSVDEALASARPFVWNSDQGSHFTSPQYTQRLLAAGVQIRMDGKGRALDNIFSERLWRTVKYEEVYLHEYATPKDAFQGLASYFQFYNHQRLHHALAYRTPAEVYRSCECTRLLRLRIQEAGERAPLHARRIHLRSTCPPTPSVCSREVCISIDL